jgi:hypothetical protein
MYRVKTKMKIEDEFFNFMKRFQKIGGIEHETTLVGRKCFDSDGCLSNIKLFFMSDKKEALSLVFHNENYSIFASYNDFVSRLKATKEDLRDKLEKEAVTHKIGMQELTDDEFYEYATGENDVLSPDEIFQLTTDVNNKLLSDEMQNEIFKQTVVSLAKYIAEYYVTKVVLDDVYCRYENIVFITGSDPFVKFITAAPVNGKFTRQGKKRVVTDGEHIYVWDNDNLFYGICTFDNGAIIGKAMADKYNGFHMETIKSIEVLERFCKENDIELVKVPEDSIDRYEKIGDLLNAAGLICNDL